MYVSQFYGQELRFSDRFRPSRLLSSPAPGRPRDFRVNYIKNQVITNYSHERLKWCRCSKECSSVIGGDSLNFSLCNANLSTVVVRCLRITLA